MQFILSGSKRFRKNGGPHLKGSRRPRKKVARPLLLRPPKVVFFGAQAEKNRLFILFYRRRLVMVFGGEITFSTTPKTFSATNIFFRPPIVFFRRLFFFWRPKPKIGFFGGRLRSNIFRRPSGKTSAFFFCFFRRRLVMVFGGQMTFSTAQKYFAAAFFLFLGAPKNRRFSAPKPKNRLFRRASKEQRPKSCILGSTTIRASGGENCPSRFERVPGFSWNPSGGSTKASNEEEFMKPP